MNRTMGPLFVVIAVLTVGANATRLMTFFRLAGEQAPAATAGLAARSAAVWVQATGGSGRLDGTHAALAAVMLLAAAAFLFALRGIWLELGPRGPRRAVLTMARRGRATAEIARRTRLSQDAVRTLLRPAREGTRLRA